MDELVSNDSKEEKAKCSNQYNFTTTIQELVGKCQKVYSKNMTAKMPMQYLQ
jgi:hypothetical protein